MSDNDNEYIPPAPAFCRRFPPAVASLVSKQTTQEQLVKLGSKIQEEIGKHNFSKSTKNLETLNKSITMSGMLNEYFSLDNTGQKARMLDLFTELETLRNTKASLEESIDAIQKEYKNEKEDREELSDQCDAYIEEIDEKDEKIKNLESKNCTLEIANKVSSKNLSDANEKFGLTLFIFFGYLAFSINFYFKFI